LATTKRALTTRFKIGGKLLRFGCDLYHIRHFEPVLALLHQTANQPIWQA
jgi:hypothetical protein